MAWTKEQIDEIAEEFLASDVQYDLAKMQGKTEDECVRPHPHNPPESSANSSASAYCAAGFVSISRMAAQTRRRRRRR
eukprot:1812042-Prymnesium_polylepis.1